MAPRDFVVFFILNHLFASNKIVAPPLSSVKITTVLTTTGLFKMNEIIPSNLIDQLIDLSEINSTEKFFFHYPLLIWAISVALFIFLTYLSTSAAKQQKKS